MKQQTSDGAPWIERVQAGGAERWAAIAKAGREADAKAEALREGLARLIPADTEVIGFGSFARGEWTVGSDLDWTLLVDGQAMDEHITVAHEIDRRITEMGFKEPGRSRLFGEPAFSHELLHRIGGDADSNANTTRRILLLLESRTGGPDHGVRDRVLAQILKRYVADDFGYRLDPESSWYLPSFLLNDIVRYWRTVTVDFAHKRRDRGGAGWALRSFKLRMARKLIFAGGLATCFSCSLSPPTLEGVEPTDFARIYTRHLRDLCEQAPLEVLSNMALALGATDALGECLDAYDRYLGVLDDGERRERLSRLPFEECRADPVFQEAKEIEKRFQKGLSRLFLESDDRLTRTTLRFAIF